MPTPPKNIAEGFGNKSAEMQISKFTWSSFVKKCSACRNGSKHENWFIRPGMYSGDISSIIPRKKENLEWAGMLILDVDGGNEKLGFDPSPEEAVAVLDDIGIRYLLYTSYSHMREDAAPINKYRICVETSGHIESDKQLKHETLRLYKKLDDYGLPLVRTTESWRWSHLWYYPTRESDDGQFRVAAGEGFLWQNDEWNESRENEQPSASEADGSGDGNGSGDSTSVEEIVMTICTAGPGLHEAINKYAWMQAKDGVSKAAIVATIKGFMRGVEGEKDERWHERYDDIERSVNTAKERVNDGEYGDGYGDGDGYGYGGEIPDWQESSFGRYEDDIVEWPPGLMGVLCRDVYKSSPHPNKLVSLVTGLGLVAGISGRSFNVSGTGLNVYLTMLMDTGIGKDIISSFISKTLHSDQVLDQSSTFIGPKKFTSGKGISKHLLSNRCFISVLTESGFMMSSGSGDTDSVKKGLLENYTKSGKGEIAEMERYSSDEDSIKEIRSPSISLINESTPDIFLKSMQGGLVTGEIPRMHIFRWNGGQSYLQKGFDKHISDREVLDRAKLLMSFASKAVLNEDSNPAFISSKGEVEKQIDSFSKFCTDRRNELSADDHMRSMMYSRAWIKTIKIASIVTVFNSKQSKFNPGDLIHISADAWAWAIKLHEYEMAGLEEFFHNEDSNDYDNAISKHVYKALSRILGEKQDMWYKDKRCQASAKARRSRVFTRMALYQSTRKNKTLLDVFRDNGSRGSHPVVDNIIAYMLKRGYIKKVNPKRYGESTEEGYQVKDAFWREMKTANGVE